jgi:hypothetical protein
MCSTCQNRSAISFRTCTSSPSTPLSIPGQNLAQAFSSKKTTASSTGGFTEGFLGLERLVLGEILRGGSPMLEDTDREVFPVNLTWPQGQRDKWELHLAAEEKKRQDRLAMKLRREAQSGLTMASMTSPTKTMQKSLDLKHEARSGLSLLSPNIMQRGPSDRTSSLKAPTTRSRGSPFAERFSSLA